MKSMLSPARTRNSTRCVNRTCVSLVCSRAILLFCFSQGGGAVYATLMALATSTLAAAADRLCVCVCVFLFVLV